MGKKGKRAARTAPLVHNTGVPANLRPLSQPPNSSSPLDRKKYVVGVDFGTTFTSVAFASVRFPDDVKLVQTWPSGSTGDSSADQVPTEVHYTSVDGRRVWGYEVEAAARESGTPGLKWFKLLLQRQADPLTPFTSPPGRCERPADMPPNLLSHRTVSNSGPSTVAGLPSTLTPVDVTAERLRQINVQPIAVVTDFLERVRNVTVASIERTYGTEWVVKDDIMYVLTVPAIWSDSAKSLMVEAAQQAGFGSHRRDFNLVSEPESAAAYTLKVLQASNLKSGDTFVVCDAGGGTVDLISYTIAELNPLRLDECVSSSGGLCGSVYLDERFEQYIRCLLGDEVIDSMKPRSRNEMMRTWECNVKYQFGDSSTNYGYEVVVPGVADDEAKNIEDGFHVMEYEDVKEIFTPVVDKVIDLVSEQVRNVILEGEEVKAILLVGGFGTSHHLLERLEAAKFEGRSIQVLQPVNARSAIARGALLRGLDGSIVRRKRAPRFYGSAADSKFEHGKGTEMHRFFCRTEECYKVPDKMNWYVQKNAAVGTALTVSLAMYRLIPIVAGHEPNLALTHDLLACDIDDAPEFRWQNPSAVYKVCTLKADLATLPRALFERQWNSFGQEFFNIPFTLQITLDGEVLYFELLFDGVRRGDVVAEYW